MSSASESTIQALEFIVKPLPVGTNLALLHVLWALLSCAFLPSRGAVFPALLCLGSCAAQVRRSSQAVRDGAWTSDALIMRWRTWQVAHSAWRPDQFDGYRPIAVDITAFWAAAVAELVWQVLQSPGESGRQSHRLCPGG